ncbi:MAG: TldD/PmbA family protein [Gemmatimonadaceae bacterium]|nr:TldD/PmbA family protein [Gemmatimonadaceae bacterium]MCW5826937.1 TldD/PmbA family protein [Gemmatimonadaceae bacterium]
MEALNAARLAGASWADVRVQRQRRQNLGTREQQVTNVLDTDTIGCGVRVLVDGTWGFAATRALTTDGVARAARQAVALARANRVARDREVRLAAAPTHPNATWKSSYTIDPWSVPVEEKVALLFQANAAAQRVSNIRFVNSNLSFVKEERSYANTEGSVISQDVVRSWVTMSVTAISDDRTQVATRGPEVVQPMGRGWEYVLDADIVNNATVWAEQAREKLSAKSVEVGRWDLILHPSQLFLTIHESIGHPTELDRAMGYEANYAGTSFIAPPDDVLGKLKLGPEHLTIRGDRSEAGALATIGYDDDGVQPDEFDIVKNGVFWDYQTTREQAEWLRPWYEKNGMPVRSHGCAYAQSWSDVAFQRMPNVSIVPDQRVDRSWDDLIAATDKGIAMIGRASYSIDQQRYNAQFGAQICYEVRGGKIVGQLKDVAYVMRTPEFWNSIDLIGGKSSYELGGTFNDGKGQPGQANAVSHGCPPCRFKDINVINTGVTL